MKNQITFTSIHAHMRRGLYTGPHRNQQLQKQHIRFPQTDFQQFYDRSNLWNLSLSLLYYKRWCKNLKTSCNVSKSSVAAHVSFLSYFIDHHTTTLYSYTVSLRNSGSFSDNSSDATQNMLFPSNKLGTLVRILILLVMEGCAYHSDVWTKLCEKKNTHLPSNQLSPQGAAQASALSHLS